MAVEAPDGRGGNGAVADVRAGPLLRDDSSLSEDGDRLEAAFPLIPCPEGDGLRASSRTPIHSSMRALSRSPRSIPSRSNTQSPSEPATSGRGETSLRSAKERGDPRIDSLVSEILLEVSTVQISWEPWVVTLEPLSVNGPVHSGTSDHIEDNFDRALQVASRESGLSWDSFSPSLGARASPAIWCGKSIPATS